MIHIHRSHMPLAACALLAGSISRPVCCQTAPAPVSLPAQASPAVAPSPAAPAAPPTVAPANVTATDDAGSVRLAKSLQDSFIAVGRSAGAATVRILSSAAPIGSGENSPLDTNGGFDPDDFSPRSRREGSQRDRALGSGVLIRPEGYILTNDHVVEDSPGGKVIVTLADNSTYIGTVLRDSVSDLAVVKIDAGKPLPYVKLADSSRLEVGQWAIAIGSPFDQANTMTTGIVSALHRNRMISDGEGYGDRFYYDLIQTDAAINPGNSGGPLLDIDGNLIGINVAIFTHTGSNTGISFAIPINIAHRIADLLIRDGKVPHVVLGVDPQDVPYYLRTRLGTDHGAYITKVPNNTPADRAGIQPGDVITRFGTTDIANETSLRMAIGDYTPNTVVPITILRGGKAQTLLATLEVDSSQLPDAAAARPSPIAPRISSVNLGMILRPLTPLIVSTRRFKTGTKGVYVQGVSPAGPASEAGLERGSIITAVNGKAVNAPAEVDAAVAGAKSGDVVTFSVLLAETENAPAGRAVVDVLLP